MIKLSNVHKTYKNGHPALTNINIHLPPGEMVFLTGHSGAGKSTLLKLIAGLERCDKGELIVANQKLHRLPARRLSRLRRNIGLILQDPQLLPERSLFENIALPLTIAGYRTHDIENRVRSVLRSVNLIAKEHCRPSELSSGEQQRASIARAIVHKPSILLADEPTGNLDPDLALEIIRLFEQFQQTGMTILIATHNLPLIARLPYRIIKLNGGRLC